MELLEQIQNLKEAAKEDLYQWRGSKIYEDEEYYRSKFDYDYGIIYACTRIEEMIAKNQKPFTS